MVINAQRLESELDRIRVTPADSRQPAAELKSLNDLVGGERREFFQRVVGGGAPSQNRVLPN